MITPNALTQLALFMDSSWIIRVAGRLNFLPLKDHSRHPILLTQQAHQTELIIRDYNGKLLHSGYKLILSMISQ